MRKKTSDKNLRRRLSYQQFLRKYYNELLEAQNCGADFSEMDVFLAELSELVEENAEERERLVVNA